ncbi:prefoldin subunit 6 isoform X2 [Anolis sagrei]|uniref:prefoldin subunit 6 isoform X2 n=1 Tax=Anolis sagrei TaxID=38937 RepID=UPI003521D4B3
MAEPLQKKLQAEVEKYQQLQKDISKCMSSRQKLEAQLTENNIVQEELGFLDASNAVFKLIGPVLVKQDMEEAKATVGKRLEYIAGEIYLEEGEEGLFPVAPESGTRGREPWFEDPGKRDSASV